MTKTKISFPTFPARAAMLMLFCQCAVASDSSQQNEDRQMQSAQKAALADIPTDLSQCANDHKNTILIVAGIAFLVGCLLTSMSLSLGFAYYLRR